MDEFIMEYELQNVKNIKTKEYLNEVISCYNNRNYRSAIVVLYSIVIFDLLNKLKILSEIYNDANAQSILENIEQKQKENSNSPQWEKDLLNLVNEQTNLLNKVEFLKIKQLIDDRNCSAHPLYNIEYELINPNREQVRAHIRNMFEAVFCKEALLCKKITIEILTNAKDFYEKVGIEGLEKHLKSRYFSKMNQAVKDDLFKTLWKFVFKLENEECNINRYVNYFILNYLVKENVDHFIELVQKNIDFYCDISPSNLECEKDDWFIHLDSSRIASLIYFLSNYEKFYKHLTDSVKLIIERESNKHIDFCFRTFYQSKNFTEHIEKIKKFHSSIYVNGNWVHIEKYACIYSTNFIFLFEKANEVDKGSLVINYLIKSYFGGSMSWAASKSIYYGPIKSLMDKFTENDFDLLFDVMNSNSQIYELNEIKDICSELKLYTTQKFENDFEYYNYKNLWKTETC